MKPIKPTFNEHHFQIVQVIAEGGIGVVYDAKQNGADQFVKRVAIKLIREEYSKIDEFRANFIGEARLVGSLIHTNIVQTYHLGEMGGQYFMTMEYADGINLEEFITRHDETDQMIPVDLAAFILSRICRGLKHAHERCDADNKNLRIVHRDINSKNIMLQKEGDIKVTDFGIAEAADLMDNEGSEVIEGRDPYLSPEQARREVTDPRAVLFACNIILLKMLIGRNIFEDQDDDTKARANIFELPLPEFGRIRPEIDPRLEAILKKGFARDRDARYQSSHEMLCSLERYLYGDEYGPTDKKFSACMNDLFSPDGANAAENWKNGTTPGLDKKSEAIFG